MMLIISYQIRYYFKLIIQYYYLNSLVAALCPAKDKHERRQNIVNQISTTTFDITYM